ncbi:hypothetical protein K3495_g5664 [Podosphaera aphanis]|nr:hypothetical protein K3495_g5664 [Podosphaera aphanis]
MHPDRQSAFKINGTFNDRKYNPSGRAFTPSTPLAFKGLSPNRSSSLGPFLATPGRGENELKGIDEELGNYEDSRGLIGREENDEVKVLEIQDRNYERTSGKGPAQEKSSF